MSQSEKRRVAHIVDGVIIVGALAALFAPNGIVANANEEWRAQRAEARTIKETWADMTHAATSVVGEAVDEPRYLVEFLDYSCLACRSGVAVLDSLREERSDVVLIVRHNPIDRLHPMASEAARASICAEEAGVFPAMHRHLLEHDEWEIDGDWQRVAEAVHVPNPQTFTDCLNDPATTARLEFDRGLATQLGLNGTPSFVGTEGKVIGLGSMQSLSELAGPK